MRAARNIVFAAILAVAPLLGAAQTTSGGVIGAPQPSTTAIRVLSPRPGQKLANNFVTVRYELTNRKAVAASSPTFQLQLDNSDPVTTMSFEHAFQGLTPGNHKVTVQLVDANTTPVAGAQAEVTFSVAATPARPQSLMGEPPIEQASLQSSETVEQPAANSADPLPTTGSALPMLSIIGFGILVGGIVTALRTR